MPYPAGGSTDLAGRLIAQQLTLQLGVPVVVENISGVGGVSGSDQVRRAPPDGYAIVLGSSASHSVNMVTLKSNPYDPITDFAPVMLVSKYANAAFVAASSSIRTLSDLQASAKGDRGMAYATAGPGSSSYLTGELLRWHSKVEMRPVHYKGIGPAMQDVIAGHVQVGFGDVVALNPHVASGRLRIVAVGSAKRVPTLPEIPAVAETYPGFEAVAWQAFYAPKGTPDAIVRRLNAEIVKALNVPEVRNKLVSSGADIPASSPEELTAFMKADIQRWRDLAQNLKLTFE
ncbi:MAG: tripartite tricarboxylate transporter substrate-binding protein [Pseudomonadota bacterium]